MTLTNFRTIIVILMLVTIAAALFLAVPSLFNYVNLFLAIFMLTEAFVLRKHNKKGSSVFCFIISICFLLNFISFYTEH